ncbi:25953_t:CDS:2, partial [Gigaspora margarita]
VFEHKWVQWIEKYNKLRVIKYLQTLYLSKYAWTTSRVESYNAQVKRLVLNSNISLMELTEALKTTTNEESNKTKYIY